MNIPHPPPIEAVLFDWAGTVIDHGSRAPVTVFVDVFYKNGLKVSHDQVRSFMGMSKREHIRALLELPEVRRQGEARTGRPVDDALVDAFYDDFLEFQVDVIMRNVELIPGVPELCQALRRAGIRIGSTTGYPREIMSMLIPAARSLGFDPETVWTGTEVQAGRPAPWMIFRAAEALGVYPMHKILVVDDTVAGVRAGRNAGCWTAGVSATGNLLGLSLREYHNLHSDDREHRLRLAESELLQAGAHFVVPSVEDLPGLLLNIRQNPDALYPIVTPLS